MPAPHAFRWLDLVRGHAPDSPQFAPCANLREPQPRCLLLNEVFLQPPLPVLVQLDHLQQPLPGTVPGREPLPRDRLADKPIVHVRHRQHLPHHQSNWGVADAWGSPRARPEHVAIFQLSCRNPGQILTLIKKYFCGDLNPRLTQALRSLY